MQFYDHQTRSLRVILGGTIAIVGIVWGALHATPELHGALTMRSSPSEMTYEALVEKGITDNSFVRLVDVKMDNVYVYPSEQTDTKKTSGVKVVSTPQILSAANQQLSRFKTLTGRVTYQTGPGFEVDLANRINHVAHRLGGNLDLHVPSETHNPKGLYVVEPMRSRNLGVAKYSFAASLIAVVLGLAICGSGSPSLLCCIVFPLFAIVSLVGLPLRYGRGSTFTHVLYAALGMGLILLAYDLMITEGQFGVIGGDPSASVFGFAAGSIGIAAIFGVVCNIVARRREFAPGG
ncbi:hypothetical protein NHH03_14945 [Stieleria sp. TO1_6]|uniref:hypothetical protein n=1 Tax=Stieleria tagensis TaxID=2956795 RepID=UPI00209AD9BB|nr:hypothetical protein [Stieleria tagensis]MCO8123044.1 hypothetical protein [Stieleria tagensis]